MSSWLMQTCWSRAFAVIIVALVTGLAACKPKAVQAESLAAIGKEVGLTFPSGTKLAGVHRERGVDDLVAVKVEIAAADWPAFLARAPVNANLIRPSERDLLGPDEGFCSLTQPSGVEPWL